MRCKGLQLRRLVIYLLNGVGGGYVAVAQVFVRFAGFTFGKSASAYATPSNGYPGSNTSYTNGPRY